MGSDPFEGVVWHSADDIGLEGQAFDGLGGPYHRLPARVKERPSLPLWGHGRRSAGLSVRFGADAPDIFLRWTMAEPVVLERSRTCLTDVRRAPSRSNIERCMRLHRADRLSRICRFRSRSARWLSTE